MAIVFPPGVQAQGNIAVAFCPSITTPNGPKVTEITAVGSITLSCYLTDFNVTGTQNTGTDQRLCSKQSYESLGFETFSIDDLVYLIDPQGTSTTDAAAKLVDGATGFLIARYGLDAKTVDWIIGQKVDVLPVTLGVRTKSKSTTDEFGKLAYTQKCVISSAPTFDVVLVA